MPANWPHGSAMATMHEKRISCWRNQWGRLECHRNRDNNGDDDFFQSTGIWILVAFLVLGIILAFIGGVCCCFMKRRGRSSSRSITNNNGGGWFGAGGRGGDGRHDYTGNRRGDIDHGPPAQGFYATQETVYPKGDRARDRSRSRSLERERKV